MRRRDGMPLWIGESTGACVLRRSDLRASDGQKYNEAWLQKLLHENPEVLPVEQIEPGFGRLIPLCRELPLTFGGGSSGALDNLFATAEGHLLLVEAKLWRNPEARRSAIAQAMEYAAALFRLNYEELQSAVLRARPSDDPPFKSLYDIVAQQQEIDEVEFIDAVSRNLSRGRAIVAVVGDGIRGDLVPLVELLQSHAGHRFTFALVELGIYESPQSDVRIVVPSILTQTKLIERGVVQIADDVDNTRRIIVREPSVNATSSQSRRAFGITEDEFYENLEQKVPGSSSALKAFLAKADSIGVYADWQNGLNLKHASPSGNALNLGSIGKGGLVDTAPATWWERTVIGRRYNEALASQIRGMLRESKNGQESFVRNAAGKMPRISDFLPQHEAAWLAAIERYISEILEAAREPPGRQMV